MDGQKSDVIQVSRNTSSKEARIDVIENPSQPDAQGKWRGGQYCTAFDCHNCTNRNGPRGVIFVRFLKDPIRRERWITNVNRTDTNGSPWKPSINARLCSENFLSGQWRKNPENPDYEPSIFPKPHVKPSKQSDRARLECRKRLALSRGANTARTVSL